MPPPTIPRCYRHPDREGGRSCTRCGRPACSECLVQADVGSHCLDCAKAGRPDVATQVKLVSSRVLTPVTYTIIAVNVLIFLWMSAKDPAGTQQAQIDFGLSKNILQYGVLNLDGSVSGPHQYYRLVSSGFLHFSFFHVFMNMLLLFQLGNLLERALGSLKFTLLYFCCLLGGSFGVLLVDSGGLTGGASGAVFGLMAAAAVGMHRRGINIFSSGIGITLMINIFLTFQISGISIGGHMGGLAAGAICGWVMLAPAWKPLPKWAGYATPIVLGLGSVVLSVMMTA